MDQLNAELMVNEGAYIALVNEERCFDEDSGDSEESDSAQSGSSSSDNSVNYLEVTVESVRETDTSPVVVNAWIPQDRGDGEGSQVIRVRTIVAGGVSEEDPFGQFALTFQMASAFDATDMQEFGVGQLTTVNGLDGQVGFTLYESNEFSGDFGTFSRTAQASVVVSEDGSEGVALTAVQETEESSFGSRSEGGAYAVAFDDENLMIQSADEVDELGYLSDDVSDAQCLSRVNFNERVFRYGLYNANDGSLLEINSGFPILYQSTEGGEFNNRGYIGYWGLWTEGDQSLETGDTVQKENFSDPDADPETFTVVAAPGRLTRNSVEELALSEVIGMSFNYWGQIDEQTFGEVKLEYHLASDGDAYTVDGFYAVASLEWNENGRQETAMTPTLMELSEGETLYMHSRRLGGGVQYVGGADSITFFKREFITGAEVGSGELFETGSATLYCFDRCPKSNIQEADLEQWFGPYETRVEDINNAITYTIANNGDNALTLMKDGSPVTIDETLTSEDIESTQYSWGINTGPMVTSLTGLTNPWDIYDTSLVTEFFEWETGPNEWQQQIVLLDDTNAIVNFEKPIEFAYRHEDSNDRSGDAGEHDGGTYLLGYNGHGDLHGIPWEEFTEQGEDEGSEEGGEEGSDEEEFSRWYPAFSIADAVLMGPNDNYVVKALEIEQTMSETGANCAALTLESPEASLPTEVTVAFNDDDLPEVTDPPAFVDGEVPEDIE